MEKPRAYVRVIPKIIGSPAESPPIQSPARPPPYASLYPLSRFSTQPSMQSSTQPFVETLVRSLSEAASQPPIEFPADTPVDHVARAQSYINVTPSNEQKIRTFHPALSQHEFVSVYEYPWVAKVWLIPSSGDPAVDLRMQQKVIDRDVLVMPELDLPKGDIVLADPFPGNPIGPHSNYSRFTNEIKSKLKEMFPSMQGVKILPCGVMTILFSSKEEVHGALAGPRPETIGGLLCHFDESGATTGPATKN